MKFLKKGCGLVTVMLCFVAGGFVSANAAISGQNQLYFSCAVNDGVNPGFIPANECEEISSDAFFVSGNTIFVEDIVNRRIIVYKNGNYGSEIPLEWNMDVKLLYYDSQNDMLKMIYLDLDAEDATHLFLASAHVGNGRLEDDAVELSNADKVLLEYCFDEDGNLLTQYLGDSEAEHGIDLVSDQQAYSPDGLTMTSQVFSVDKNNNKTVSIASAYREQGGQGTVQECILVQEAQEAVSFAVPESHANALDRGYVQHASDGSLYQMAVDGDGIQIFKLEEKDIDELSGEDMLQRIVSKDHEYGIEPISSSYKNITKPAVKPRMDTYRGLSWTFSSSKNADKSVTANPQYVKLPGWLSSYADGRNHSLSNVPYCWGGWNAESFVSNINAGKFAGNVCTTSSDQIFGTVGMDCAGFVSVAFDLPYKHGTEQE